MRILKDGMEMAEKNGHYLQVMSFRLQTAWLSEQAYDFARVRERRVSLALTQAGAAQYGFGQLLSLGLLGVAYRALGQPERAFHCFSELTRRLEHGHVVMEWVQMPVRHSLSEYWLAQGEFARHGKKPSERVRWQRRLGSAPTWRWAGHACRNRVGRTKLGTG